MIPYTKVKWKLDVALLVAVKSEFKAILDWVEQNEYESTNTTYRLTGSKFGDADLIFETLLPSGLIIRYHIYKLPYPSMGGDATTFITTKAIYTINPYAICMIGICAGDPKYTKLGDVIVASSTVRTDFGKLTDSRAGPSAWQAIKRLFSGKRPRIRLLHRISSNHQKGMDGSIFRLADFMKIISDYNKSKNRKQVDTNTESNNIVRLGIFASGNQIVKVNGAFDYLRKNNVEIQGGDEDERILLALEMEAHSLAYAANLAGNVGWLVIKGVVDYADGEKNDTSHDKALLNTLEFLKWMLPRTVEQSFERTAQEAEVTKSLKTALEYWEKGNIEAASIISNSIYKAGIRTQSARKLRVKCVMRTAGYAESLSLLEEDKKRPWFNDAITTELVAEIYWREGDYESMGRELSEFQGRETTQILYQKALNYVFTAFDSKESRDVKSMLKKARNNIDMAIQRSRNNPRFFYNVNQYFIYAILHKHDLVNEEELKKSFKTALAVTTNSLHEAKSRGLIYVYNLLLLAMANRANDFDIFTYQHQETDVIIALDNVDMVYKRIDMVYSEDLTTAESFLTKLTRFIRTKKAVGRAVRVETRGRLDRYK